MLACVALSALLPLLGPVAPAPGQNHTATDSVVAGSPTLGTAAASALSRLAGSDRYATPVAIRAHRFPDPAAVTEVYLARGDVFADALTAGSVVKGPVLLVPSCSGVPATVAAEIARLDPERVYALGGADAVCDATLAAASSGRPLDRLVGADRYGTAAAVARHVFPDGAGTVYLAAGRTSPDAVAGGTLTGGPILLTSTDGTGLPLATAEAIAALHPDQVVALGGPAAVSETLLQVAAGGRPTGRLAGPDRWATAVEIARAAHPTPTGRVYLARGDGQNYVDAVAAGVLADGPVLLTRGSCDWVPTVVQGYLSGTAPTAVLALGGNAALCDTVLRMASRAVAPRTPVDCTQAHCVALTFDDGPSPYTWDLLDTLVTYDVPATFFLVGQQVAARPATTRRIAMEGHQVGNHSYSHPDFTTASRASMRSQLETTAALIGEQGIPHPTTFRPPYGAWSSTVRGLGRPLILWSVDTRDWETRNTAAIAEHVRTHAFRGDLVLQHDSISQSVAAVPAIISDLRSRGYTLVTLDELVPGMAPGDLVYEQYQVAHTSTTAELRTDARVEGERVETLRDDAPAPQDPGGP